MAMNTFDISHNYESKIDKVRGLTANPYENITGKVDSMFRHINYQGSFIGIDENHLLDVKSAIIDYSTAINKIIEEFNENASITVAFKGQTATALSKFILEVKTLLIKYSESLRLLNRTVDEVLENYKKNVGRVSVTVTDDADALRSRAESVSVD